MSSSIFGRYLLFSLLMTLASASFADGPLKTLLLFTYHDQLPWQKVLLNGYRDGLAEISRPYQVYEERFDVIRLGQKDLASREEAILQKYKSIDFDQVITESDTATQFLINHPEAFKSAKKYIVNTSLEVPKGLGINRNGLQDFEAELKIIRETVPQLTNILLLDEAPERAAEITMYGKKLFGSSIPIDYFSDFSFDQLYKKVESLDSHAAILFSLVTRDKLGNSVIPFNLVKELCQKTKIPIFVIYDTLMGSGAVGGYVLSARKTGQYIAGIVGGQHDSSVSFNGFYFDYKESQARGLSIDKLPTETVFINKPDDALSNFLLILIPVLIFASLQIIIIAALIRSLAAKRRMNHQLELERGRLAETVAERTKELLTAKEIAEAASLSKSRFLANMSHELRTPLNAVIGLSHILQETGLAQDQLSYNKQILESSTHLLGLIGDILDFSKIEAGNLELSPVTFSIETILNQLRSSFSSIAQQKGIDFIIESDKSLPQVFYGDQLRLSQVLFNLISNAIRFTKLGSVSLKIELVTQTGDKARVMFKVTDTGIGMSTEVLDKIFSPFTQADSSITRRFGGTGLGLSISKSIVDQMGGTISIDSQPGLGTSFYFTIDLPVSKASSKQVSTQDQKIIIPINKTILVAEDNEVNILVIGGLLRKYELLITVAKNGIEAVEACKNSRFDLVFMDVQMPELDGISATKIIRSHNYTGPIVALSAGVTHEDHVEIIKAGMNDFLEKPIDPDKLLKILDRWIRTV